jgi:hypothetical protein
MENATILGEIVMANSEVMGLLESKQRKLEIRAGSSGDGFNFAEE